MKAWITYSLSDREFVDRLKRTLHDADLEFQDLEHEIMPGDNIVDTIYKSIAQADIIFIILSKESVDRQWFSTELGIIISEIRNNPSKKIMPILKDKDVDIPPFINQYQFLDLSDKSQFESNIQRLNKAIKSPKHREISIEERDFQISNIIRSKQDLLEREKEQYEKQRKQKQRLVYLTILLTVMVSFITLFVFLLNYKGILELKEDNLITTILLVAVGTMTGVFASLILTKIKENTDDK